MKNKKIFLDLPYTSTKENQSISKVKAKVYEMEFESMEML